MKIQDTIAPLRDHLGDYYLAHNPTFEYVVFQQEQMVPLLEAVERGEEKRVLLLVHPGSSKSTLVTVEFVSWYIGKHPNKNVITLSYSDENAGEFGGRARDRMRHPLHSEIFPRSALSLTAHGSRRFTTIAGGNLYALGFNGAVMGKRGDLMVVDDPNKSEQDVRAHAKERYEFFSSVGDDRMRPGGAIVICTSRICVNDFADRVLQAEGRKEDGGLWTVLSIPAEKDGTFLWEEHFGKEKYERAKKKKKSWNAFYMQNPLLGGDGPWFADIPLKYYDQPIVPRRYPAYMICDPALSKKSKNDRTSIMVLVATPEKKLKLADWVLDRLDPTERTGHIVRLINKWKPKKFIYEEYGLVADTFHLEIALKKAGISLKPIPVGRSGPRHNLSKEDRIEQLEPDFTDELIEFPRKMERTLYDGETVDLMRYFEDDEIALYAGDDTVLHDEGLDTLSRIHDPELMVRYPETEELELEEESHQASEPLGGRTWESQL